MSNENVKTNEYSLRSKGKIDKSIDGKCFKIILAGDGCVGKTSFVHKLLTGVFEKKYIATIGVEVHPLSFKTNYGTICLNMWDTAGQEKFSGLKDGYYVQGQALVLMCDCTSNITKNHLSYFKRDFERVCGEKAPLVVINNKTDIPEPDRKVTLYSTNEYRVFESSVKKGINIYEPLEYLVQRLTGKRDLKFLPEQTTYKCRTGDKKNLGPLFN